MDRLCANLRERGYQLELEPFAAPWGQR
ncbi:MAG: hypothetical protein ACOYEV_12715 [Candidatus Nanopelagicales bacterium]